MTKCYNIILHLTKCHGKNGKYIKTSINQHRLGQSRDTEQTNIRNYRVTFTIGLLEQIPMFVFDKIGK